MSEEIGESQRLSPEAHAYYQDKKLLYCNAFWMLFGTFGMGLGLGVASNLVPLHMDRVGMSATQISLGWAINGWVIAFLMIYIAYRSDYCQVRWGRRLPFLLIAMPPVCIALLIFPHTQTILACILAFAVFRFFLNFKEQTYPFLSYDIAPKSFWGRMWALQIASGALGQWLSNVGLMPLVDIWGETPVFYLASAILGLLTLVSIYFIKEPPIRTPKRPPFNIKKQLSIGFGDKRNWLLFIGFGLAIMATLPFPTFIVLQAKNNVLLSSTQIGWVMSWMTIASMVIAFPAGWLTDRFGALLIIIVGYAFSIIACVIGYPAETATSLSIAVVLLAVAGGLSYNALLVFLVQGVSRDILASFSACNGMFSAFFAATMQVVCGLIIDHVGGNYAVAFPVGVVLGGIGIPMLIMVNRWRMRPAEVQVAPPSTIGLAVAEAGRP